MARHFSRWTPEQEQLAREMMATGASAEEFLLKLGRTKDAAYQRLYSKRCADGSYTRRKPRKLSAQSFQMADPVAARPNAELLVAAIARTNAPRSITAWLCGDPPPGYSALDKRHGGG
jgi:hypothetical protein